MVRCDWCLNDELYRKYHDEEWGVPVHNDRKQFEFLVLEMAQAGLSWLTILKKRENYRRAYQKFDPQKVARFSENQIRILVQNPGIIRNRLKIASSINNARRFLEVQKEFGSFSNYIWDFTGGKTIINKWRNLKEIPAKTELSDAVSKDMKKRGFTFIGSTIIYAHLQATGLVNDHLVGCFRHRQVQKY
jgi:DNA-3-methyladenine glycosylase I